MISKYKKRRYDTTQARRQTKRRAEVDAAAVRDRVLKDERQATGDEAITLWKRGDYVMVPVRR